MKKILTPVISLDIRFFHLINNNLNCKLLDLLMPLITNLGDSMFIMTSVGLIFVFFDGKMKVMAWEVFLVLSFSAFIVQLLKRIIGRIRPFYVLKDVNLLTQTISIYSFPSGHTVAVFSLAKVLVNNYPNLKALIYFLALLVGFSRAYLGVHYPSDIIIGALLGLYVPELVYFFF